MGYDLEEAGMSELTMGEIKRRYPALVELVQGDSDLAYRARVELLTLWGIFDPPDESAELERLRGIERATLPTDVVLHETRTSKIMRLRAVADQIAAFSVLDISPWIYDIASSLEAE